ncbi:hypothetical protein KI387_002806, partial [Taxus chinensis]
VVVSTYGHDGPFGATGVKRLKSVEMIDSVPGMKCLDMNVAEDVFVRLTREVVPGIIVTGMEDAIILLQSGKRAASAAFRHESISRSEDCFPSEICTSESDVVTHYFHLLWMRPF